VKNTSTYKKSPNTYVTNTMEHGAGEGWERLFGTNRVGKEGKLHSVKQEEYLTEIKRRKDNWIGHNLQKELLSKTPYLRKDRWMDRSDLKRGRSCKQLLDYLK
jgi:transposase